MGQQNQSFLSNKKQILKIFTIIGKAKEQNITYLQHINNHKSFILRQAVYNIQKQQEQAAKTLKTRESFNHPFLTNLVKFQSTKQEGMCSKYFRILSLWQFPKKTLSEQNNERALSKKLYTPDQIRSLLKQISQGLLSLQQRRIPHECLTSKSILVDQPLKFIIIDPCCFPIHPNPELIYHNRNLKNIYLTPDQCFMIDQQDISKPVADSFKEDVFTIGMLVLEAGLLQRQDECYEQGCSKINWQQLERNMSKFEQRYGHELRKLLGLMLVRENSKRLDWLQLTRLLQSSNHSKIARVSNNVQGFPVISNSHTIKASLPMINHISYRPKAVPSSILHAKPPAFISSISPMGIIHHYSAAKVVQIQNERKLKGSFIFSYQNNQQNIQNSSLKIQNTISNSQTKGLLVSQSRPASYSGYKTSSNIVQNIQANVNNPIIKNTPQKHPPDQKKQLQINFPAVIQKEQQNQIQPFQLSQGQLLYVIQQVKNGSKYQGFKLNGKREGWGKYKDPGGGCYEGEWKNDMMTGKGKLYYQSGEIAYDGYLHQDLFHGSGVLYNEFSEALTTPFDYKNFQDANNFLVKYDGQFRNDKKEGHGQILLTNGQYFKGSFHEDNVQGYGIYHTMSGQQIRGIWHENKLQRQI